MVNNKVVIGPCTLYCGDCRNIIPTLDKIDAIVTDPPYGIGFSNYNRHSKKHKNRYKTSDWDNDFVFDEYHNLIKSINVPTIIWGGNYFPCLWDKPCKGIFFWNKNQPVSNFSAGELAWSNIDTVARHINYNYFGNIEGNTSATLKEHPTQKPVAVMQWCMGYLPNKGTVLDCFMGSGTTGIACIKTGRKFIGIELDPDYFKIACERIRAAYSQPDMLLDLNL